MDNRHQNGTSIICGVTLEYSHVKWRMLLKSIVMEQKLYIGMHKLDSIDTQVIGFVAHKHPEETHVNRYEAYLMGKMPAGMPKFVIEWIYPKMTSVFDEMVKTDVLVIRVSKKDMGAVDKVMTKLLPPQPEGEYYVSFIGLDDEMKWKVYMHQNWYRCNVRLVQVSGFNNIAQQYEVGMNRCWSFRAFMKEQPL